MHLLKISDVEDLLDLRGAMRVLTAAFAEQGRGAAVPWPPSLMFSGGGKLIMRSGGLPESGHYGVRVTSGPEHPSFALVYESPSGELRSLVAYPFSDLRLAASVALGVDLLARPQIRQVAMLGSGRNALSLLEAVQAVRPVAQVRVYSRQPTNRSSFAAAATAALGVPVRPSEQPEDAVAGADLVVVATSTRSIPALQATWLEPNALVVSIGTRWELDESVYTRAALVVTSSKVQELTIHEYSEDWPLVKATTSGQMTLDDVRELGEVVTGTVSRPPAGIVVYRDAQGGFTDVALAAYAYEQAVSLGRGSTWDPA